MQVQVNTDNTIDCSARLVAHVETVVTDALHRFSAQLTRVEVHMCDERHAKGGDDKRCMMEARIEGRRPLAVTHHAATLDLAIGGAADKLAASIARVLGRLRDR